MKADFDAEQHRMDAEDALAERNALVEKAKTGSNYSIKYGPVPGHSPDYKNFLVFEGDRYITDFGNADDAKLFIANRCIAEQRAWRARAELALSGAESFIAGFEDDESQEGVVKLLDSIRGLL